MITNMWMDGPKWLRKTKNITQSWDPQLKTMLENGVKLGVFLQGILVT